MNYIKIKYFTKYKFSKLVDSKISFSRYLNNSKAALKRVTEPNANKLSHNTSQSDNYKVYV